jgi:hypothetical protein
MPKNEKKNEIAIFCSEYNHNVTTRRNHIILLHNVQLFIHSFIHQWLYSSLLNPGLFFSFVILFTQSVGLLGRVMSPSQGRYLHAGQHKINAYTDIRAFSGIRTYDPSARASDDSSYLRQRAHCDWLRSTITRIILW